MSAYIIYLPTCIRLDWMWGEVVVMRMETERGGGDADKNPLITHPTSTTHTHPNHHPPTHAGTRRLSTSTRGASRSTRTTTCCTATAPRPT